MPEVIPGTEDITFKEKFIERYSELTDWESFKCYSLSFLRRSIRVNTLLADIDDVCASIRAKGWVLEPVAWCKEGFFISHEERRDVGNLLEHKTGKVYIQEAASMVPPLALDPQPGEHVLDMCAAPGSKTTQIAAMMKNTGLLVANDYKGARLQSLGINLQRMGITNCVVSLHHGKKFKDYSFDRVLVDAPCSGTGTIRKSLKTIRIWNPSMISKLAREQKQLAEAGFLALKKGGTMVYSTCSVEPEENEGVVHHLLSTFDDIEVVPFSLPGLKKGDPIMSFLGATYHEDVKHTFRLWPQDNDTEGFFVAKLRKKA